MKKKLLFLVLSVLTLGAWAQTSPYTGVAVGDIVSGNDYYLYNVESGLWLQNNDRKANDWSTRAQLGCRGLDFRLNAVTGGYKINAKFGRASLNRGDYYLDNNDDHVWVFEAKSGSVSNAVTIKSDTRYLTADNYTAGKPYNNMYKVGEPNTAQWYLNNPENSTNGTWQIVTKEERLAKMVADGATQPADATWLIKSPDFANNDTRYSNWTKTGTWSRGGDANGDWGRGSLIVESWNSGSDVDIYQIIDVPNGEYELTFQGFYRDGSTDDVGGRYTGGTEQIRAKFYANHVEADLRSIIDPEHMSALTSPDRWPAQAGSSGYYVPNSMADCSRAMNLENVYHNDPIQVIVTDGHLKIGVKKTGSVANDWVIIDNFKLTYLGPVVDLTPYQEGLNNAIAEAEAFSGMTTDVLGTALANALNAARAVTESTDINDLSEAATNLSTALINAQTVDVSVLRPTVALASAEGISIPASVTDFLANGMVNEVETHLRLVRNLRKLNAIEKVDITRIECSEPANEEADYYLYNVGAQIFFSTTSDYGTHIAIDNPGMLIHFRPDGEWSGAPGRPVFHLSGNGWNGMNWEEEYWDKNGENKLAFVPVEGKDKVYNMCEWDNYNWHFVYDPADDVCDSNTHYWNAVQKRDWNRNDYKDNPYAQWMLVSPEAYKAAMYEATEANPLDVTFLIENPNFTKAKVEEDGTDEEGNIKYKDNWNRGWTGIGGQKRGADREPWMVIEWFEANADMKQTITGLTPGKYRVSCYGFFRDGSSDNEATKVKNGETLRQLAKVVAINGDNERKEALLPNVTSEAGNMPGIGEKHGLDDEFACWPWQANEYFQTGLYKATTPIIEVGEDGNLTIGVEMTYGGEKDGTWVVVGNFRLESLGVTESVTVSPAGYATYASDNALDFTGSSIKAFYATESAGTLSFTQVNRVPAGTGVLLYADGGATKSVPVFTGAADDVAGNVFVRGTGATVTYADDNQNYILFNGEDGIGFYKANNNTVATNRAYIHVENGKGVKGFVINLEDDATGISDLKDSKDLNDSKVIYNLAGQRLSKTQKGINIVNGKKILK